MHPVLEQLVGGAVVVAREGLEEQQPVLHSSLHFREAPLQLLLRQRRLWQLGGSGREAPLAQIMLYKSVCERYTAAHLGPRTTRVAATRPRQGRKVRVTHATLTAIISLAKASQCGPELLETVHLPTSAAAILQP